MPKQKIWCAARLIWGITYFDLANNYGPPAGSAEKTFGAILKEELSAYRDENGSCNQGGLPYVDRAVWQRR